RGDDADEPLGHGRAVGGQRDLVADAETARGRGAVVHGEFTAVRRGPALDDRVAAVLAVRAGDVGGGRARPRTAPQRGAVGRVPGGGAVDGGAYGGDPGYTGQLPGERVGEHAAPRPPGGPGRGLLAGHGDRDTGEVLRGGGAVGRGGGVREDQGATDERDPQA